MPVTEPDFVRSNLLKPAELLVAVVASPRSLWKVLCC